MPKACERVRPRPARALVNRTPSPPGCGHSASILRACPTPAPAALVLSRFSRHFPDDHRFRPSEQPFWHSMAIWRLLRVGRIPRLPPGPALAAVSWCGRPCLSTSGHASPGAILDPVDCRPGQAGTPGARSRAIRASLTENPSRQRDQRLYLRPSRASGRRPKRRRLRGRCGARRRSDSNLRTPLGGRPDGSRRPPRPSRRAGRCP